jgi:hypothetical protein
MTEHIYKQYLLNGNEIRAINRWFHSSENEDKSRKALHELFSGYPIGMVDRFFPIYSDTMLLLFKKYLEDNKRYMSYTDRKKIKKDMFYHIWSLSNKIAIIEQRGAAYLYRCYADNNLITQTTIYRYMIPRYSHKSSAVLTAILRKISMI